MPDLSKLFETALTQLGIPFVVIALVLAIPLVLHGLLKLWSSLFQISESRWNVKHKRLGVLIELLNDPDFFKKPDLLLEQIFLVYFGFPLPGQQIRFVLSRQKPSALIADIRLSRGFFDFDPKHGLMLRESVKRRFSLKKRIDALHWIWFFSGIFAFFIFLFAAATQRWNFLVLVGEALMSTYFAQRIARQLAAVQRITETNQYSLLPSPNPVPSNPYPIPPCT